MDRFCLEPEVREITGLNSVTRWRMEKRGEFPARRRISTNRVGWLQSELREWMESRPVSDIASPKAGKAAA